MSLIKRYPNRKLYDTAAKQYVSLDAVAEMIRRGDEVRVVDHATGDDLTTVVLMQIIVGQEKQKAGLLPPSVLTGLVRAGDGALAAVRRGLSALQGVDEEIQRRMERLVALGELAEDEGRRLLSRMLDLGSDGRAALTDELLEQRLIARGLPTRADIETLAAAVDALAAEVESLSGTGALPG